MSAEKTSRKKMSLAVAILAALSVVGVSGAALAQSGSTPAPTVQAQTNRSTETVADDATTEATQDPAVEATEDEAAEAAEDAAEGPDDDSQDPMLNGSITAPAENNELSEADEAKALESLATITADEAAAAANAAVPGDIIEVELDNENGSIVYSVEIDDGAGGHIDVKVDAGNGAVLHQHADNDVEG